MKRLDALESIAWSEYHFDGHTTGRDILKKQMYKLVDLGLVYSKGIGCRCDKDGGIKESERPAEIFGLTELGKEYLKNNNKAIFYMR